MTTTTYDGAGNLTDESPDTGPGRAYVWNQDNRLQQLITSLVSMNSKYNADGPLVTQRIGTKEQVLLWDAQNLLRINDIDHAGPTSTETILTMLPRTYGDLVSLRRSGQTYYSFFDALGSTTAIMQNASPPAQAYHYAGYGTSPAPRGWSGSAVRWTPKTGQPDNV